MVALPIPPATTIDEVILRLETIIEECITTQDRMGYFAALYNRVTLAVRDGIQQGKFDDGPRMERLDVVFAGRYLDALDAHRRGARTSRSWVAAFEAARSREPLILQHLLLGINAHINLDLGAAAAQTSPGSALPALRDDFMTINSVLGEMLDDVQDRIARVSPWMGILDRVGERTDEIVCGFCLERSRDLAWTSATRLAALRPADVPAELERIDRVVAALAVPIRRPGPLARSAMLAIRLREPNDVGRVLDALG